MSDKVHERRISIKQLNSIKKLYLEGKYSRALREIEDYVDEYPKDEFGRYLYAQILTKAGYDTDAIKIFTEISDSKSPNKYSSKIEIAKIYMKKGNYKAAVHFLNETITESPYQEFHAKELLSSIYVDEGKYNKAVRLLKEISSMVPNYKIQLAKVYSIMGNVLETNEVLKEIDTDKIIDREAICDLIIINRRVENFEESLKLIERLKDKKDRSYYKAVLEESFIYNRLGDYDSALSIATAAAESDYFNESKDIYINIGFSYLSKGSYNKSKENYLEAKKSYKKEIREEALYRLGYLEIKNGNYKAANEYFETLERENKHLTDFYYKKKIPMLIKQEKYEEADKYLEKLKNIGKNNSQENRILKLLNDKKQKKISDIIPSNYRELQIQSYDEEAAISHVEKHRNTGIAFNKDIDIKSLFDYTKQNINEDNICLGEAMDIYELNYPGVSNETDRYRIIVIPNTKEIITMYPVKESGYFTLGEWRETKRTEEAKEQSRKEKLYKRFNKINK